MHKVFALLIAGLAAGVCLTGCDNQDEGVGVEDNASPAAEKALEMAKENREMINEEDQPAAEGTTPTEQTGAAANTDEAVEQDVGGEAVEEVQP